MATWLRHGSRRVARAAAGCAVATLVLGLAACGGDSGSDTATPYPGPTTVGVPASSATAEPDPSTPADTATDVTQPVAAVKPKPLRPGEKRMTLRIPEPYTPSAPNGIGTDDYRCFLLDPHLSRQVYLTGSYVQPDAAAEVHHVILFTAPPADVSAAEALDAADPGEGWTCFGGSGLHDNDGLNSAPWLGAWAPGGKESLSSPGFGKPLAAGSRIIMQVHYNLLVGASPDQSATVLRYQPGSAHLTPLETMLLPAPVEMPCRKKYSDGPLCTRAASMADVRARFGAAGSTNDLLYFLCGGQPVASNISHCDRVITEPTTVRGVAGHMHLLGRSIKIEVNPGKPDHRTILDIPIWNFDNQASKPIKPVHLDYGDVVRVTCRHVLWLRDRLPQFQGIPDKYVVWGEGTTDEMCLGILTVTRP
jgi:hypothetical protein